MRTGGVTRNVYRRRLQERARCRRRVRRQARRRQAGRHRLKVLRLPQSNARILLLRQVRVFRIYPWSGSGQYVESGGDGRV